MGAHCGGRHDSVVLERKVMVGFVGMLAALLVARGLRLLERCDFAGVEGPFPCLRQALGIEPVFKPYWRDIGLENKKRSIAM